MRRAFRILAVLIAVSLLITAIDRLSVLFDIYEAPRRPLPPTDMRPWLSAQPAPIPFGNTATRPTVDITVEDPGKPHDSIGTAFHVAPGVWLTAGHVLDSCRKAYVRVRDQWLPIARKLVHPVADVAVALVEAAERPPEIHLTKRLPVLGQDGYHFGYPGGEPAAVHTRFVGSARIRKGRPGTPLEQGWMWAERARTPPDIDGLGGLSGGPQVDRTGAVQGITVLHSPQAGRLTTTPVSRARELLQPEVALVADGGTTISPRDYGDHGTQVREAAGTVLLVFCSVWGLSRPK